MTVDFFGTRIKFGFSFFAVVTLMLLTAQNQTVIICLFSSMFHEFGHLFFMCIFSQKPSSVVFGAFGIRIERPSVTALSYKKEAVIAAGGVLFNFILCFAFVAFCGFIGSETVYTGVFVNFFIAVLNCLPVCVLDAGNFLRYILLVNFEEEKVEHILKTVSTVTAVLFACFTVCYTIFAGFNLSLIAVCVYILFIDSRNRSIGNL